METEVWPLVRRWPSRVVHAGARRYRFFEQGNAVVLAGGIGHDAGQRAAELLIDTVRPDVVIAAGLAGGLSPQWTVGRTMVPAAVIDEGTGRRFLAEAGAGVVVSSRRIAGAEKKRELARRFAADLVDMEGAVVAEVAQARGMRFLAAKAVSDEMEFDFPPLQDYVGGDGRFQNARFAVHAIWHPQWWTGIARLQRNSGRAARALAGLLRQMISSETQRPAPAQPEAWPAVR